MGRLRSVIAIIALTSLSVGAASCGTSNRTQGSDSSQAAGDTEAEDSGKHLAGEFNLISQEDSYRGNVRVQVALTFADDGSFKRQDQGRIEEGSYLITPKQELVLYIEKVNGEQRAAARAERYQIGEERDDGFTLVGGSFGKAVFRKR